MCYNYPIIQYFTISGSPLTDETGGTGETGKHPFRGAPVSPRHQHRARARD